MPLPLLYSRQVLRKGPRAGLEGSLLKRSDFRMEKKESLAPQSLQTTLFDGKCLSKGRGTFLITQGVKTFTKNIFLGKAGKVRGTEFFAKRSASVGDWRTQNVSGGPSAWGKQEGSETRYNKTSQRAVNSLLSTNEKRKCGRDVTKYRSEEVLSSVPGQDCEHSFWV